MHKGYAFVQFLNQYDARNACHGEDGRNILSQVLGECGWWVHIKCERLITLSTLRCVAQMWTWLPNRRPTRSDAIGRMSRKPATIGKRAQHCTQLIEYRFVMFLFSKSLLSQTQHQHNRDYYYDRWVNHIIVAYVWCSRAFRNCCEIHTKWYGNRVVDKLLAFWLTMQIESWYVECTAALSKPN